MFAGWDLYDLCGTALARIVAGWDLYSTVLAQHITGAYTVYIESVECIRVRYYLMPGSESVRCVVCTTESERVLYVLPEVRMAFLISCRPLLIKRALRFTGKDGFMKKGSRTCVIVLCR